jgi:hypothetical protein
MGRIGQKRCYFEKQTQGVIENKESGLKTNPNKPKNKARKLLKIRSCGKNKAKNKAGHIVENTYLSKNRESTGGAPSGASHLS